MVPRVMKILMLTRCAFEKWFLPPRPRDLVGRRTRIYQTGAQTLAVFFLFGLVLRCTVSVRPHCDKLLGVQLAAATCELTNAQRGGREKRGAWKAELKLAWATSAMTTWFYLDARNFPLGV